MSVTIDYLVKQFGSWFESTPSFSWNENKCIGVALWNINSITTNEFFASLPNDFHIICVHLNGYAEWSLQSDDRRYDKPCLPGTANLGQAGTWANIRTSKANARVLHFYIGQDWLLEQASRSKVSVSKGGLELIDPMNAVCRDLSWWAMKAAASMRDAEAVTALELEAISLMVASNVLKQHSNLFLRDTFSSSLAGWQIKRSIEALSDDSMNVDISTLAANVGLSAFHFARAFKQATGLPPHKYQIMLRIDKAKDLLLRTRLSIADVAASVGYEDQSHFARTFRKEVGLPPREFRRAHRGV
jgi:AraC family transcriptional regulator